MAQVQKRRKGRYSKEQKLDAMRRLALELVSGNGGVQSICDREPELPDARTIWQWLFLETIDTEDKEKPLNQLYAQAKAAQMAKIADDTLSIADDDSRDVDEEGKRNMVAVNRDRLRADTRKWLLSKLDRRNYGDKAELVVEDKAGVTMTELMRRAHTRAAQADADTGAYGDKGEGEKTSHSGAEGVGESLH
jgi:hypothetical protein